MKSDSEKVSVPSSADKADIQGGTTIDYNNQKFSFHYGPMIHCLIVLAVLCKSDLDRSSWLRFIGLLLTISGVCANLFVVWANQGRMPAKEDMIPTELQDRYDPMHKNTKFSSLADWIPFREWLFSPGDLCLWFGVALVLFDRVWADFF